MSLKKFLIFMSVVTLICWIGWITVVFYIDPNLTGFIGLFLFYVSLFFALIGTFSLLGFFFRVWFLKTEVVFKHVGIAFRQALLFSLLVIGAFVLQGMRVFTWWNAALFVISLSFIELFFLTRKSLS